MTEEIWKPVVGYEGRYEVSNLGRVRSVDHKYTRPHFRTGAPTEYSVKGRVIYQYCKKDTTTYNVRLSKGPTVKTHAVHRLVAQAFIPNPDNLPEVNHMDENRHNNRADNLEWCTGDYNLHYGTHIDRSAAGHWKKILQCDMQGNVIREFNSITQAANTFGVTIQAISRVLIGKNRQCRGFLWKYKD